MFDEYIGVHDVWRLLQSNGIYIGDCRIRQLMKNGTFGPLCINSGNFPGRPVHLVSRNCVEEYIMNRKEAGNKQRYRPTKSQKNSVSETERIKTILADITEKLKELEKLLDEN